MITAYHFLRADRTAGSGDESPWEIGETRTISDLSKIVLCQYGYHSSPTLWDALNYAPGPMACLVKISKPLFTDEDANQRISVSARRKLIKAINIDRELRLFTCDCAEHVLHIFERERLTDKRPREAIEVSRRFADGKATKGELDAAQAATWNAAQAATWNAAQAATWNAARDAEIKWQRSRFDQMFGGIFE